MLKVCVSLTRNNVFFFSNEDKIITQNVYKEKSWSAYKIWRNHPSKKRNYCSVKHLLKKFRETDSGDMAHDGLGLFLSKKTWI